MLFSYINFYVRKWGKISFISSNIDFIVRSFYDSTLCWAFRQHIWYQNSCFEFYINTFETGPPENCHLNVKKKNCQNIHTIFKYIAKNDIKKIAFGIFLPVQWTILIWQHDVTIWHPCTPARSCVFLLCIMSPPGMPGLAPNWVTLALNGKQYRI